MKSVEIVSYSYLEPLFGILFSVIFVGESLTFPQIIGGILILGSTFIGEMLKDRKLSKEKVFKFDGPKEVLDYLEQNIKGGETILFKGAAAMQLEAIIEKLLADKSDIIRLPRREAIFENKRKGLDL